MHRWIPLLILASAQFVMVLDTTVMNVSITTVVKDLDTTVSGMQAAITAYTLVMAAFMLTGARLGDILGRRRAFALGLAVYGLGSLITALAVDIRMLFVGWSFVEGMGAVLVIPAIAALVVATYEGAERALAYGVLGGIAAAGAALGPLIGGWTTANLSWRWVFAGEVVLVVLILTTLTKLPNPKPGLTRPRLDFVGTILSAAGLGTIVFAILNAGSWGWVRPRGALEIGGTAITPFGFSAVPVLIIGGALILGAFQAWEERMLARGKDPLVDLSLLQVPQLRVGLASQLSMQMVLAGLFFTLPVFLQTVIGLDAFETGIRILPLSLSMIIAALLGPKLGAWWPVRRIVWTGLALMLAAAVGMVGVVDLTLRGSDFAVAMVGFGIGTGLLASQLGNVIMSAVDRSRSSEVGGLQGTSMNLGSSLGTALIGAVLIASLSTSVAARIEANADVTPKVAAAIADSTREGVPIVSVDDAAKAVAEAGIEGSEGQAVVDAYAKAQVDALQQALGAIAVLVLAGFWASRRLPKDLTPA